MPARPSGWISWFRTIPLPDEVVERHDRRRTPLAVAEDGARRAQRARTEDHRGTPAERRRARHSKRSARRSASPRSVSARSRPRHGKAQSRRWSSRIPEFLATACSPEDHYLSVTILTLSPAETTAPGDSALSTRNRSSFRSTPTMLRGERAHGLPRLHGNDADMQRLQRRLLGGAQDAGSEPLTERATASSDGAGRRVPRSAAGRPGRRRGSRRCRTASPRRRHGRSPPRCR